MSIVFSGNASAVSFGTSNSGPAARAPELVDPALAVRHAPHACDGKNGCRADETMPAVGRQLALEADVRHINQRKIVDAVRKESLISRNATGTEGRANFNHDTPNPRKSVATGLHGSRANARNHRRGCPGRILSGIGDDHIVLSGPDVPHCLKNRNGGIVIGNPARARTAVASRSTKASCAPDRRPRNSGNRRSREFARWKSVWSRPRAGAVRALLTELRQGRNDGVMGGAQLVEGANPTRGK